MPREDGVSLKCRSEGRATGVALYLLQMPSFALTGEPKLFKDGNQGQHIRDFADGLFQPWGTQMHVKRIIFSRLFASSLGAPGRILTCSHHGHRIVRVLNPDLYAWLAFPCYYQAPHTRTPREQF